MQTAASVYDTKNNEWEKVVTGDLDLHLRFAHDVFRPQTGVAAPVMVQNIANTGPKVWEVMERLRIFPFLTASNPSDEIVGIITARSSCRMFVPMQGNCLMLGSPRSKQLTHSTESAETLQRTLGVSREGAENILALEKTSASYVRYAILTGLVDTGAAERFVIVPSLTDFDAIMPILRHKQRPVMAYMMNEDWLRLCEEFDVPVLGGYTAASEKVSPGERILGDLNDKRHFRNEVVELYKAVGLCAEDAYPYPRRLSTPERPLTAQELLSVEAYYGDSAPMHAEGKCVFLAQETVASGGTGNYTVTHEPDGTYRIGERSFSTLDEVAEVLHGLNAPVEVVPFLDIRSSPSIGLCITTEGVSAIGPFTQLIGENASFAGFQLDRYPERSEDDLEVRAFFTELLGSGDSPLFELATEFGRVLHQRGYRGYASLDIIIFRDPDGVLRAVLGEVNQRLTGTCMAQMVASGHPLMHAAWKRDEISFAQDDWVPLTPALVKATQRDVLKITEHLEASDVPILKGDAKTGVHIVSPPTLPGALPTAGDRSVMSIAYFAHNDEDREKMREQLVEVMGWEPPTSAHEVVADVMPDSSESLAETLWTKRTSTQRAAAGLALGAVTIMAVRQALRLITKDRRNPPQNE